MFMYFFIDIITYEYKAINKYFKHHLKFIDSLLTLYIPHVPSFYTLIIFVVYYLPIAIILFYCSIGIILELFLVITAILYIMCGSLPLNILVIFMSIICLYAVSLFTHYYTNLSIKVK